MIDCVGTQTSVEGNMNAAKYIDVLEENSWALVIVWYFEENRTCLQYFS